MNGPQCIECGGFDECNHGMEEERCDVCGDRFDDEDGGCDACRSGEPNTETDGSGLLS